MSATDEHDATEVALRPCPLPAIPAVSDVELRYEVTEGRIVATIGGCVRTYRPGEIFIVPAGVPHSLEAADSERSRLLRRANVAPLPAD